MKKCRLLGGVLAVSVIFALNAYFLIAPGSQAPAPAPLVQEPARPDGGIPDQRERVDVVIDNVAEMEWKELVKDLSVYSERYELTTMAGMSSRMGILPLKQRQVLADRRAMKLFELLQAMPAEQRSRAVLEVFDTKMKLHHKLSGISGLEQTFGHPDANYHGLHVALFLCAMFADPAEFVAKCDEWAAFGDANRVISLPPGKDLNEFVDTLVAGPDMLFVASLYTTILTEQKRVSEERLRKSLEELRTSLDFELPALVTFKVFGSSAHTTDLDFLHRHAEVAADSSAVIKTFTGLDDWTNPAQVLNSEKKLAAVAALREWLVESLDGQEANANGQQDKG